MSKKKKIITIEIKKLFGMFNHKIELNQEENITIIHGPNGYGKTTILKLINDIFNFQLLELLKIYFDSLTLEFADDSKVTIEKIIKNEEEGLILTFKDTTHKNARSSKIFKSDLRKYFRHYRGGPRFIRERNILRHRPISNRFERERILEEDYIIRNLFKQFLIEKPAWVNELFNSINVKFIEAQRLFSFDPSEDREDFEDIESISKILLYSKELASLIKDKLGEYANLSQSLDRSFPFRLVKIGRLAKIDADKFVDEWTKNEEKRNKLKIAGLLDEDEDLDIVELLSGIGEDLKTDFEQSIRILSFYLKDVKKKLQTFDELSDRIDLLLEIINKKFLFKNMTINKKSGFVFKTNAGDEIGPTSLSSGEQHELIMLYELLFKVDPNPLILIDEPELSLHVVWQQKFLKDLHEINKLSKLNVLIATHSPQIIHDRWDLTTELKGPSE